MMSVLEAYKEAITDTENQVLEQAINDLNELGDLLEKGDVHFFEEEKFEDIIAQARLLAKHL